MQNIDSYNLLDALEEIKLLILDLKGKLYDFLEEGDIYNSRLTYNMLIDNEILEAEIEDELQIKNLN